MAHKIIWSLQARDDLREIVLFIAAHNPAAAEHLGCGLWRKRTHWRPFPSLAGLFPKKMMKPFANSFFDRIELFIRLYQPNKSSRLPVFGTVRAVNQKFLLE